MKQSEIQETLAKETGHSGCRIDALPEALSGNFGARVDCNDCGAVIERYFDGHDVGSDPSYEDPSVHEALERMKLGPVNTTHKI